ncbi:MAG: hypothetical protein JST58_09930 [Bacteroidetes bacterium]|nr:hypothetical protein [Bacteroidota bacterium]
MKDRREVAVIVSIVIGLVLGEIIKKTTIGLVLGLFFALISLSFITTKKSKDRRRP